jgi:plasmid stability protein
MANLTIKGIPEDLYQLLKQRAGEHRRSISREVLACLQERLGSRRLEPAEMLARVDAVRTRLRMRPWTLDELRQARDAGHE